MIESRRQWIEPGRESAIAAASRGQLQVRDVDPRTEPGWAAFVAQHPDGSIYHHPAWLEVLQREYRRPQVGLACRDAGGALRGVLALCRTKGLPLSPGGQLTGRRWSSLPRTPLSGPLALDRAAAAALVQAAVARVRHEPGTQLQLKVASPSLDGMVAGLNRVPWRLTYVLTLPENPEALGPADGRARRRNAWAVNKAKRLGVSVRAAETEADVEAWHRLYLDTMRGLGVPARSLRFFRAAWEILGSRGLMRLLLAEQRDEGRNRLLAGSCFLVFGQTVSYAFTGWRRDGRQLRANDLIHWRAIQDACREGYRYYDFGEVVDGQASLAAFKQKWGGEPRRLYRYHDRPADPEWPTREGRGNWLERAGREIWKRLPLRASERLSDWLYSYL